MGSSSSSEEANFEEKTVESSGHVNNNIVVQTAKDTHHYVAISEQLLFATYLLVAAEVIKLGIYLYTQCRKAMKKRYDKS